MKNETIKSIMNRRSTRRFKEEQITEEELQILLDAGIQAPTAINEQPWHFTVIQDKEMINNMSDKNKEIMRQSDNEHIASFGKKDVNIFYKAPTLIIVSGKTGTTSPLVDCSAAIENILVAAESIGLGSVWIGSVKFLFADKDEVKKFNLPEGYEPYYAVSIGYKENDTVLGPSKRNKDVVNYIR